MKEHDSTSKNADIEVERNFIYFTKSHLSYGEEFWFDLDT